MKKLNWEYETDPITWYLVLEGDTPKTFGYLYRTRTKELGSCWRVKRYLDPGSTLAVLKSVHEAKKYLETIALLSDAG